MRDYIILNGVNSNTITGLLISTLPPITKPKIRTQTEEIDGRDGDIVTKLGYSAYTKEFTIGLYGNFDIDEVIAFFNSEGTVVFSNENDKYYNYQIIDQIDYDKLIRFKKASVKMHVQPFKYPLEETPVEITIETLNNEAEAMSIDNTSDAPITLALKGNTSQDSTPTPDAPVEVKTVTGGQNIAVCGKNIIDISQTQIGKAWNNTSNSGRAVVYAPATPNTDYTISYTGTQLDGVFGFFKENQTDTTVLSNNYEIHESRTITAPANTKWIGIQFNKSNITLSDIETINIQVEKGSQATTYELYKSQSYEINLGKNLFTLPEPASSNNVTFSVNNDGTINLSGTASANTIFYVFKDIAQSKLVNDITYTLSASKTIPNGVEIRLESYNGSSWQRHTLGSALTNSIQTKTAKANLSSTTQIRCGIYIASGYNSTISNLGIQLEKGSQATSFSQYKTPIELCKIGDYQDRIYKEAGKWYLYKEIGKVILNQATTGSGFYYTTVNQVWDNENSGYIHYHYTMFVVKHNDGDKIMIVDDYFPSVDIAHRNLKAEQIFAHFTNGTFSLVIRADRLSGNITASSTTAEKVNALNEWLGNHNITNYYVMETPTTTEITDAELIGQLNAIENARSYDPTTNISQNTSEKPFIINATAVKKGTDTGIVDNEGNIYSKPTIDIEGSGTVGIYLDGNQMFSVDLSNATECIIDTTSLEAYNPTTSALMNRQVTGDYSNFKLNAGENEIKVSGSVTKATITNYTRWL